jgi:isoquinoline 1-oxidoreductase subunit beta
MTYMPKINRRSFFLGSGAISAGLVIGFKLPLGPDFARAADVIRAADGSPEIDAWVVIRPDDTVVIRIARSEMGQGTLTGLAQLVAEELNCDWSKVTTEFASPAQNVARKRVWKDFSTGGSRGIRDSNQYVREGGAIARIMLIQAAANAWSVPAEECSASNSVITHKGSGRTVTYGKIAEAAAKLDPPASVTLKDPKTWTIAGKPLKRLDTPDKIVGKTVFGIDTRLPGMLYASINACPVFGGKLKSYDEAKVQDMPGVKKVVKVGDNAIAVVADSWWRAKKALEALPIVWDEGENAKVTSATIAAFLKEGLDADQAFVGNQSGDVKGALAGAAKVVEATYSYPYQNHAPMEPMNATALYTSDRCEVWCSTQNGEAALAATAEASGLPVGKCEVYKTFLGGGFGRRGQTDYVRQAVEIAKAMPGTPVKLLWTREEDMTHCYYHPITQCKMTAGFDANKNLIALHMRISGQSILSTVFPARLENGKDPVTFQGLGPGGPEGAFGYNIPNILIDHAMRNPSVPAGFWRGVNTNHNAIYVETFIDQLAHEIGEDPLAFRLKYLKPKHAAVLKAVADKAGYGTPAPKGVYRGLSQIMGFGSYVAGCAEVSVNDGQLKIHRIIGGTNSGHAVNPEQIARQVEGSFVYGLSAMLYGECTVRGGHIEQKNFDTYQVMRLDEMPKVEAIVMPDFEFWGGVGEPTIAVAAPAVLNAIFAATGKRIYNFPLKNNDLRSA